MPSGTTSGWKRALCGICPAGCWVRVDVRDGHLVGIKPDEGHPLGMLCRRGEHAPEIVYSEHRLRHPMKRRGPKGSFEFDRISWDEAYDLIVKRMGDVRNAFGPEAMAVYTGRGSFELSLCDIFQPRGVAVSSASSVLFPFGSPNTMGVGALCYVSFAMIAPHVTFGRMLTNLFWDMENADLCVVWGANPATDSPPLDMARLEQARSRGAEVIVIDPRRTETASRCDAEWIPIRPGTDGALALGMIQSLIEEEDYDEAFTRDWSVGFDELAQYTQHFRPEVVEGITGVPADKVRELALRIRNAGGACPVMYTGLEYSNSGIQAIRAVFSLWAMAGQIDSPGGIGLAMADSHFPINRSCNVANPDVGRAAARDRYPMYSEYRGESHATGLLDAVLKDEPYPIRGLIVHGASLLTSWPQTPVWREALQGLDFLCCIDRQLTADAAWADVVLPATTQFEIDSYMTYGPAFRLREKVIEPVGEARSDYLIMAELAHRLGYGHLYPQTEEEVLRTVLDGSGFTLEQVREAGGTVHVPTTLHQYRKWEKGGLRSDGQPGFDTPSGKFEFASSVLAEYGYEPLPKYTEPTEGPLSRPDLVEEYPLVFNSGARPHTDFRSQHHGIAGLLKDNPEPTVELNAEDADARGVESGDLVEVRTPRGAVRFRARVTDTIVRGAVEANMGGGGPVGPEAWQKNNVNELTDVTNLDEISGFPVYKALLCDVARIEPGTSESRAASAKPAPVWKDGLSQHDCGEPVGRVYLDNNATTDLAPAVREAMTPWLESGGFGNPSSIHNLGKTARRAVDDARRKVASLIGARPRRVVFTGGGSEADNLAIKGLAFATREGDRRRIITSAVEHPAVLNACRFLGSAGFSITVLDVGPQGLLDPDDLKQALGNDTLLVSVMMANNEVGSIQPTRELAVLAHSRGALFHTDAVQAAGKIPVDVSELGADLLSLSAHKFHGPKGIGALFVGRDVRLEPLVHGGRQEMDLRAGTENVAAIVGMGRAADLARVTVDHAGKVEARRDRIQKGLEKLVPDARVNGPGTRRLPNTLNMTLPGLRGESLVIALDQKGISISSGSACKSGDPEPSHALLAMGMSEEDAHCSIRVSLSDQTTDEDVDTLLQGLEKVLEEMKNTVRFLPCK